MENVFHSGKGNFGVKILFRNGNTQYFWNETESARNDSYKSNEKGANLVKIEKVKR